MSLQLSLHHCTLLHMLLKQDHLVGALPIPILLIVAPLCLIHALFVRVGSACESAAQAQVKD